LVQQSFVVLAGSVVPRVCRFWALLSLMRSGLLFGGCCTAVAAGAEAVFRFLGGI